MIHDCKIKFTFLSTFFFNEYPIWNRDQFEICINDNNLNLYYSINIISICQKPMSDSSIKF